MRPARSARPPRDARSPVRSRREESPGKHASRRAFPWPPLAAALAAALAWAPSLANGFARDDGELVPAILRDDRTLNPILINDF